MQELCELGLNAKGFEMSTPSSFCKKYDLKIDFSWFLY